MKNRNRVLIIAEAGSNWRLGSPKRDLEMAKILIEVAAESGADVVKFQTYCSKTVYVENAGPDHSLAHKGAQEDITAIFDDLAMSHDMIPSLVEHCKKQSIEFMSTPFSKKDFEAVNPHVSRHKLASAEINHLRLLELMGRSGKPLILSTGACREEDIEWAVNTFYDNGGKELTLLQCTMKYPAESASMNLLTIPWMKKRFNVDVGLSDHSRHPLHAPLVAVALGATVIEKHFTLHNDLPGPDHSFAVTPQELKEMVVAIREAEQLLGLEMKEITKPEKERHQFARRGIQVTRPLKKGDLFHEGENIDILRPGNQPLGVHPMYLKEIEGKSARRDMPLGIGLREGDWE